MRGVLRIASGLLVVWLGVCSAASAWAQPNDDAKKEAKEHYKNAETAMAASAYEYAASEYGMAYELMKDPILFFKIGEADQKAGKCAAAVTYFKRYLKEGNPNADFKKKTDDHIAECGGTAPAGGGGSGSGSQAITSGSGSAVASTGSGSNGTMAPDLGAGSGSASGSGSGAAIGSGSGSAAGSGSGSDDSTASLGASFTDEKPSGHKTAAWISVATGLAAGTVGAVLLLSANSTEKDIEDLYATTGSQKPPQFTGAAQTRYDELVNDGNRFNTLAEISFGVAGAAVITAVVLFATDHGGEGEAKPAAVMITPTVSPTGGGFAATFRF